MRRNIAKYMLDSLKQDLRPVFEDLGLVSKERSRLAARYLSGAGLEIGALQKPLRLPR